MDFTSQIIIPSLLVNKEICRGNIRAMKQKADKAGVDFRPHFKTHQSKEIARLYRDEGVDKICVSSPGMAEKFIEQGWKDICIAFPFNTLELDRLNKIASKAQISILIENRETAMFLSEKVNQAVQYFIEIDNGYHRSGVEARQVEEIQGILELITNPLLSFAGFLSHFGNTYKATSIKEIKSIYRSGMQQLDNLKSHFQLQYPGLILSVGDTPSASLLTHFEGADEIRPGNFVYYDIFQHHLGVCSYQQIAVCVACPVVSVKNERLEAIIYGGAVHLSKESITDNKGNISFGEIALLNRDGTINKIVKKARVISLSQEHGIILFEEEIPAIIKPGAIIGVLPVHSCLTANLLMNETFFIE